MKEILITPNELTKYMTEANYKKFIKELTKKFKNTKGSIWIVAQILEKKDCL